MRADAAGSQPRKNNATVKTATTTVRPTITRVAKSSGLDAVG